MKQNSIRSIVGFEQPIYSLRLFHCSQLDLPGPPPSLSFTPVALHSFTYPAPCLWTAEFVNLQVTKEPYRIKQSLSGVQKCSGPRLLHGMAEWLYITYICLFVYYNSSLDEVWHQKRIPDDSVQKVMARNRWEHDSSTRLLFL